MMNNFENILHELERICPCRSNFLMSRITSFGIGGPVKALITPGTKEQLSSAMDIILTDEIAHFVIGKGTNILVNDAGYDGIMIMLDEDFAKIEQIDGGLWSFGAGVSLSEAVSYAAQKGFGGYEQLAGIPGSVGGAVVMNAGAYDVSFHQRLRKLELHEKGEFKKISADLIATDYRKISVPVDSVIVFAEVLLEKTDTEEILHRIEDFNRLRWETQPMDEKSAGCVFKNPPNMHAGKLIDETGLKALQVGEAMVSPIHANFIVNNGHTTAQDVWHLIQKVREHVYRKTGVELELEIIPVGFDNSDIHVQEDRE